MCRSPISQLDLSLAVSDGSSRPRTTFTRPATNSMVDLAWSPLVSSDSSDDSEIDGLDGVKVIDVDV